MAVLLLDRAGAATKQVVNRVNSQPYDNRRRTRASRKSLDSGFSYEGFNRLELAPDLGNTHVKVSDGVVIIGNIRYQFDFPSYLLTDVSNGEDTAIYIEVTWAGPDRDDYTVALKDKRYTLFNSSSTPLLYQDGYFRKLIGRVTAKQQNAQLKLVAVKQDHWGEIDTYGRYV